MTPRRPAAPERPPIEVLERRARPVLVREVVRWRDARGRFARPGRAGTRPYRYLYEVTETGRPTRLFERQEPTVVQKTVLVPSRGERSSVGSIIWAMLESSVTSVYTQADRLQVLVRGRDRAGKLHRFKLDFDMRELRTRVGVHGTIVARITRLLRDAGYRPQYPVRIMRERRGSRRGLAFPIKWDKWNRLEPLRDLEIVMTAYQPSGFRRLPT